MYEDVTLAMYMGFCKAKNAIAKKASKLMKEESGMETLETIILIVVAVVVVGFLVNALTKSGFQDSNGNDVGLIGYLFDKIKTMFDNTFDASSS